MQVATKILSIDYDTFLLLLIVTSSIANPDPNVFGPPGSGSGSQRYGSESGSFYHQAKIIRKILVTTVL
jgi:hypothetical protein